MPGLGQGPQDDLDTLDQTAATLPVSQGERLREAFGHFEPTQSVINAFREDFAGDLPGAYTEPQVEIPIDPDAANARFGVPGYLRFNQPVVEADAAFQQHMALQRQYRDQVFARTSRSPLTDFGAGLAGALLDPTNLTVAAATYGLGDATLGAFGLGEAADSAAAVTRVGRLATLAQGLPRTLAVGAIDNAPFVGTDAYLSNLAGDPYDGGDALRDLAAGAVLHTAIHTGLRLGGELFRAPNPEGLDPIQAFYAARGQGAPLAGDLAETPRAPENPAAPAGAPEIGPGGPVSREALMTSASSRMWAPPEVDALPPAARYGAWVKALDEMAGDRPVDVAQFVAHELEQPDLARLDERDALVQFPARPPTPEGDWSATAVTTRGTEIPVRYAIAELRDLITSHTDDLEPNPDYPSELQPRDRGRLGAMARNYQLEQELNPKLLLNDVGAGSGAPIVGPDGVVESGNGRTIALRRSAAANGEAYHRYYEELELAQGYGVGWRSALGAMRAPILIRIRTEPLTGAERAGLAREMNADVVERMGPTEQAMSDATRLDPATMALTAEWPFEKRAFTRAFLQRVAPDAANSLVDEGGRLTAEGERRIGAALTAKAYGDPRLVEALYEAPESPLRNFGEGLKAAAPAWSAMRDGVAKGEIAPAMDLTDALRSAAELIRGARESRQALGPYLAERLGQGDFLSGRVVSPETEGVLRMGFRDEGFARPVAADKLGAALARYAERARAFAPGPDLFGDVTDGDAARNLLADLADKFRRGDDDDAQQVRPPGRTERADGEAPAAVIDVQRPGGRGEPARGPAAPQAGEGGEHGGAGRGEPAGAAGEPAELGRGGNARGNAEAFIRSDPELRALADANRLFERVAGGADETPESGQPNTLAEAVRAAAVCLAEESE